jgi:hypothetical protein
MIMDDNSIPGRIPQPVGFNLSIRAEREMEVLRVSGASVKVAGQAASDLAGVGDDIRRDLDSA